MIKHTILVLFYNQEKYVDICLNSILNQKTLPYEIIIGDDCSTDRTSDILINYKKKYPNLIKLFIHKKNKGIEENINFLISKVNGNIVSFLAGDDYFDLNCLFNINYEINKNQIDLNSNFIVVTNTIYLFPNGEEKIFNNYKNRHKIAFQQRIRYSLDYRSIGISISLLKEIGKIEKKYGVFSDWIWTTNMDLKGNHYYSNSISSYYRIGTGVTSHINLANERLKIITEIKKKFKKNLKLSDYLYLKLDTTYWELCKNKSFINYILFIFYYYINVFNIDSNNYLSSENKFIPNIIKLKLEKKL